MSDNKAIELLELYGITDDDIKQIRNYGRLVIPKMDEFIRLFYEWLSQQPEYDEFFPDEESLKNVQRSSAIYWQEFFSDDINSGYIEKRQQVGELHARIGLPLPIYLAAMNQSLMIFSNNLYDDSLGEQEYALVLQAMARLIHFDTVIVVESYTEITNEAISAQSRTLMEMSTPVTQIWEGVLFVPIVGLIDSKRAQDVMNSTLAKIASTQSRAFIMDISGVAVVDTAVANYLIKVTKATRLMGCESTISGVSPAIAQTIVELGIDVGTVKTTATMQDALASAFKALELTIKHEDKY